MYLAGHGVVGYPSTTYARDKLRRSSCGGSSPKILEDLASCRSKTIHSMHTQGRFAPGLYIQTSIGSATDNRFPLSRFGTESFAPRGCEQNAPKRSDCSSQRCELPRFLQSPFSGAKEIWGPKTSNRLVGSQFFPSHPNFQNGDCRVYSGNPQTGPMGYIHRPLGRIFPYTNGQLHPQIPTIPGTGFMLPIRSSSVWPSPSTSRFHEGGQGNQTNCTVYGNTAVPVYRRLVEPGRIFRAIVSEDRASPKTHPSSRVDSERREVGNHTYSDLSVSGLCFRPTKGSCLPTKAKVFKSGEGHSSSLRMPGDNSKTSHVYTGSHGMYGEVGSTGSSTHATCSSGTQTSVETERVTLSKSEDNDLSRPTSSSGLVVFTDASPEGWGAHMGQFTAQGLWTPLESQLHSNLREFKAVILSLKALMPNFPSHKVIEVASDNSTVVWYINKQGGTRSPELIALTWRLLSWCQARQIVLSARHIPGVLNVIADTLSRKYQVLHTEWSLSQEVFHMICRHFFTPLKDLFATSYNCKLPLYVSPVADAQAIEVDAMHMDWNNKSMYAFPPTTLVPRVVDKLLQSRNVEMLLVAPFWETKVHCLHLMQMCVSEPLRLPLNPKLLKQPHLHVFHNNPSALNLHAFRLKTA